MPLRAVESRHSFFNARHRPPPASRGADRVRLLIKLTHVAPCKSLMTGAAAGWYATSSEATDGRFTVSDATHMVAA